MDTMMPVCIRSDLARRNRDLVYPEFVDEFIAWAGSHDGLDILNEQVHSDLIVAGVLRPGWDLSFYGVPLYCIARVLRPSVVVESGISTAMSTRAILAAMERNQHGHLYSIDIRHQRPYHYVAVNTLEAVLGKELVLRAWVASARWTFIQKHIVDCCAPTLEQYGPADLYWQDSGEQPAQMNLELSAARRYVRHGGIIAHHNDFDQWDRTIMDGTQQVFGLSRPHVHMETAEILHNVLRGWQV